MESWLFVNIAPPNLVALLSVKVELYAVTLVFEYMAPPVPSVEFTLFPVKLDPFVITVWFAYIAPPAVPAVLLIKLTFVAETLPVSE